ncbi:MAG: trigger factor [Saprospiraceae bacterium]
MAVTFTPTENLQGTLTIHIQPSEYQSILQKELNEYKNKAQLKGFRKGKTPVEVIKKLYGNSILQEVVEKSLQNQILEYLKENKLNILGQPLTNDDQEEIYYDIKNPDNYTFKFDIGYTNDFDVIGLDKIFDLQKVTADQKSIDDQFEKLRERMGELTIIEGPVKEEHLLAVNAIELDESNQIKEDGLSTEFSVWLNQLDLHAKDLFLDKMVNDTLDADIRSFHPDKDETFIRERYFNKSEEGMGMPSLMKLTISEIKTMVPAEENQAFFDKAFGPDQVKNEEEAKTKIKEELEHQFVHQSEALLFRDLQDHLLKENKIDFPESFLKRWLKVQNPSVTDEDLNDDYPDFQQNLLWTILRDKFLQTYEIKVSAQEVRERMRQQIFSYFGGMALGDMSFLEPTINKMMQNREQVEKLHDEIITDKLFDQLKSSVSLQEVVVTEDKFKEKMELARKDSVERREKSQKHKHQNHDHEHHGHEHLDHDHEHHDHEHSH